MISVSYGTEKRILVRNTSTLIRMYFYASVNQTGSTKYL